MPFFKVLLFRHLSTAAFLAALAYIQIATAEPQPRDDVSIAAGVADQTLERFQSPDPHTPDGKATLNARLFAEKQSLQYGNKESQKYTAGTYIFVSQSMAQVTIDSLLQHVSGDNSVFLVFRGVKGENLRTGIAEIQNLSRRNGTSANVVLDPTLFKRFNITTVPTIVIVDPTTQTERGRVLGITNPGYLAERLVAGEVVDLGVMGTISDILEPDLAEVLKAKAAGIDWSAKKQESMARFWQKQAFTSLPTAMASSRRELDPTVTVTRAISDGSRVVVPSGKKFNPLNIRPFGQALLVINPTSSSQMAFATRMLSVLEEKHGRVTVIATEMDPEAGWDGYKEASDVLDRHIYLLQEDVRSRFDIRSVPTVVWATQDRFIIDEYGPEVLEEAP